VDHFLEILPRALNVIGIASPATGSMAGSQ
jgi:hypothetical protein